MNLQLSVLPSVQWIGESAHMNLVLKKEENKHTHGLLVELALK